MNREQWLTEVAKQSEALFKGFKLEPYRLTCGWPSRHGLGKKNRVIGECHALESSKGGTHEIFISPLIEDSLQAAGVMCHELAHVAAGVKAGHKGQFVKVCNHVGLTKGKPTHIMPGQTLSERLQKIIDKTGQYPHKALVPALRIVKSPSSFTLECAECGCKVSMTPKWLEEAGAPTCACGGSMELYFKE